MSLEKLLRMEIKGTSTIHGGTISYSPEFRVTVQSKAEKGVHIIIHADGHNSDTLDFLVKDNELVQL